MQLTSYDMKTRKRRVIKLNDSKRMMVNSLLWDEERNCVWVGTKGCLYQYDIDGKKVAWKTVLPGVSLKSLAFDVEGNLLMGTDVGLYVFDVEHNAYNHVVHDFRNARSLCNNIICDILRTGIELYMIVN